MLMAIYTLVGTTQTDGAQCSDKHFQDIFNFLRFYVTILKTMYHFLTHNL